MRGLIRIGLVAVAAFVLHAAPASAGTILDCGPGSDACKITASIDGVELGDTRYVIDQETGDISFGQSPYRVEDSSGNSLQINGVSGNADPILGFSAGASTGGTGASFSLTLTLPIALEGPIDANSSISYSLSSTSSAGAQIAALLGDTVLVAQEVDSSVGGLAALNKGVDVGDTFFFVGGPQTQNSPVYTASSVIIGDLAYDLMSITVAFTLSASSNVGLSGFVQQVPEPGTASLLALGLVSLAAVRRRR